MLTCAILLTGAAPLLAINGEILDQQLTDGKGYTVLRVWGSHYDMGYAHAWLLHEDIAGLVGEVKVLAGDLYVFLRAYISAGTVWEPNEIADEFDGMVAALAIQEPNAGIDALDLKVLNSIGDLNYLPGACRSHSCWGHFVAPPTKTITTRRLDYGDIPISANHHVLCVWLPTDGSPGWANLGLAGVNVCGTGANEFGTCASLHDYNSSSGVPFTPWLSRATACRLALTFFAEPNVATHADDLYAELQNYDVGTGGFLNFHVPEGYGAVITCRREPRPTFYKLRKPQPSYFGGDVLITTNDETDGTYTPSGGEFMADYYQALEDANQTATLQGCWDIMGTASNNHHRMSVAYRERRDMTIWFDGRLEPGRTPRVELEWSDLDSRKTLALEVVNSVWGVVELDPNQPIYEPNQVVTLTAVPDPDRAFRHWRIYDPNHPDDANYATNDSNETLVLVMSADQHVTAVFKCGSGMTPALPLLAAAFVTCGLALRRTTHRIPHGPSRDGRHSG